MEEKPILRGRAHLRAYATSTAEPIIMKIHRIFFALLLIAFTTPAATALERVQLAQIYQAVEQLLRSQTAGLPGRVNFAYGEIDARLNLAACANNEAFVPPGARLWGNTHVGVRCGGANPWTVYVPVSIKVIASVVVATGALAQGRSITTADIATQESDLTQLPGSVITDPAQAVGRIVTLGVAPGQPLRLDMLRSPPVVQEGQSVTLRSQGPGFRVSAEGRALGNAADGQVAQVRIPSGHTVSGIARPGGIVEMR
jgi:flagellar basal body P-ring formation protein FlgA